jgi:hypothetical protein
VNASTSAPQALSEAEVAAHLAKLSRVRTEIARVIVGQDSIVEQLLIGLLAGGHCMLEGVPGHSWCVCSGARSRSIFDVCNSPPT